MEQKTLRHESTRNEHGLQELRDKPDIRAKNVRAYAATVSMHETFGVLLLLSLAWNTSINIPGTHTCHVHLYTRSSSTPKVVRIPVPPVTSHLSFSYPRYSRVLSISLTRVTKKLHFGSGDYPDKLLFHQALNEGSNSSDREQSFKLFVPQVLASTQVISAFGTPGTR